MSTHWQGKFKFIPDKETLLLHFWEKHYKHPLLFPEFDLESLAKEKSSKLWKWLNHRYPYKCKGCGKEMEDRDAKKPGKLVLCDECVLCINCATPIKELHANYSLYNKGPYCNYCFDSLYTKCHHCGEDVRKSGVHTIHKDSVYHPDGIYLHEECFWDHYTECFICNELLNWDHDEVYKLHEDADNCFCKNCYEREYPPSKLPSFGNGHNNPGGREKLEKQMAAIILRYYANLATEQVWKSQEPFRVTEEELTTMSQYFVATAAAELRHAPKCKLRVDDYWCLKILHTYCNSLYWQKYDSRNVIIGTTALLGMNIWDCIKFLQSAYGVFYSENWRKYDESFGGKNWANCCLQAYKLLSTLNSRNGYADNLLWETCLNASHNNRNWLDKVPGDDGEFWVLYVLNMGAKCTPEQIMDIFYHPDPFEAIPHDPEGKKSRCDFSRLPYPEEVWIHGEEALEPIPELTYGEPTETKSPPEPKKKLMPWDKAKSGKIKVISPPKSSISIVSPNEVWTKIKPKIEPEPHSLTCEDEGFYYHHIMLNSTMIGNPPSFKDQYECAWPTILDPKVIKKHLAKVKADTIPNNTGESYGSISKFAETISKVVQSPPGLASDRDS